MLTFLAETREFAGGSLHNGDKPSGESIARHLARVIEVLPKSVQTLRARADAGFYCWDAVKAYTEWNCEFVIVARKTVPACWGITGGGLAEFVPDGRGL
jgi:hypothetical protein